MREGDNTGQVYTYMDNAVRSQNKRGSLLWYI